MKFIALSLVLLVACVLPSAAQDANRERVAIVAGPTVHVSAADASLELYENLTAGDPVHPGRLVTCSMVMRGLPDQFGDQFCYASFDDGLTWVPVLKLNQRWNDGDPAVAYGLGDDVYVVSLVYNDRPGSPPPAQNTIVYKSTDGGHTWSEASRFAMHDRDLITIDTSSGKYSGRVYVAEQGGVKDISGATGAVGLYLWRSLDGGKTFLGPVIASYPQGFEIHGVGTGAVLSDGTFVMMFGMTKPGQTEDMDANATPNAELRVVTSRDGGETFDPSVKIADIVTDRPRSEGSVLFELAADPGSTYFKDRLYAVFPAIVDDRVQIELCYSADKGKTWSTPVVVNDDRSPVVGGHGPDQVLPSVAVNNDGVVLVTWYDRRNAGDNLGWQLRAAASLDGGETFSASVPVSANEAVFSGSAPWDLSFWGAPVVDKQRSIISMEIALNPFFTSGGHTSGLAADSTGVFHPTWIDNHTGVAQLWSASVTVQGAVVKHGESDLADLDDISKSVALEFAKPQFDRSTGVLTVAVQLKNTSKDAILAPVKLRVLSLTSGLGVPAITNADNGADGTGAVWDFSAYIPGGKLDSLQRSQPRTLTFRLSGLRSFGQGRDFKPGLFQVDARVYGKSLSKK